jgi:hypothetical protein
MTYQRLAYDDAATTSQMHDDAAAVGRELHLPPQRATGAARHDHAPADYAMPVVSEDLAEVAAGLELHFD